MDLSSYGSLTPFKLLDNGQWKHSAQQFFSFLFLIFVDDNFFVEEPGVFHHSTGDIHGENDNDGHKQKKNDNEN